MTNKLEKDALPKKSVLSAQVDISKFNIEDVNVDDALFEKAMLFRTLSLNKKLSCGT